MAGCQEYLDQAQGGAYDFNSAEVANNMADYGYCAGSNAAIQLISNSAVVKEIVADIAMGELEAAKVIAMLTGTMAMFTEVTGTVAVAAAATSVMPYVAICVVVVVAAVEFFSHLGAGPQLWVPNPLASPGANTVTITNTAQTGMTITFEKINIGDYAGFINTAIQWLAIPANAKIAVQMDPQTFADQHNLFIDSNTITTFANNSPANVTSTITDGGGSYVVSSDPTKALMMLSSMEDGYKLLAGQSKQAPGAYELLRAVQVPAATAVIAAMPLHLGYLTNSNNWNGFGLYTNSPLAAMFPALKIPDIQAIYTQCTAVQTGGTEKTSYAKATGAAGTWINSLCPAPSLQEVMDKFGLPPSDACDLINAWIPANPCASPVPNCVVPVTQITIPNPNPFAGGTITINLPGNGSSSIVSAPTNVGSTAASAPTSATTKVVGAAAAIGAGALLYHVYVKKNSWGSTEHAVVGGVKGTYSKTKGFLARHIHVPHFGRRANPIDPAAATGGRTAAFRVNLLSPAERIALTRSGNAILYRYEKPIAKFKPSKFQKSKIRAGVGEVLIFTDQLE